MLLYYHGIAALTIAWQKIYTVVSSKGGEFINTETYRRVCNSLEFTRMYQENRIQAWYCATIIHKIAILQKRRMVATCLTFIFCVIGLEIGFSDFTDNPDFQTAVILVALPATLLFYICCGYFLSHCTDWIFLHKEKFRMLESDDMANAYEAVSNTIITLRKQRSTQQ